MRSQVSKPTLPKLRIGGSPPLLGSFRQDSRRRVGGSPEIMRTNLSRNGSNFHSGNIRSSRNDSIYSPRSPLSSKYVKSRDELNRRLKKGTLTKAEKL